MMNIVVPMAGRGSRFASVGYKDPKPLIPVEGRPMIDWVVECMRPSQPHRFVFLCLGEHLRETPMRAVLERSAPGCLVVGVESVTEGAACTVLLAREWIDGDAPLMIANSDQWVCHPVDRYLAGMGDADGLIMTFWNDHPKWSYARQSADGSVVEVVEKQVVSDQATVGVYNFRHGRDFVRAADLMIAQDLRVNNEFYVAPAYNILIAEGRRIALFDIEKDGGRMHGLGTPEDLEAFLASRGRS
jgi:NDP-sugar pyrophosphorylase family protein